MHRSFQLPESWMNLQDPDPESFQRNLLRQVGEFLLKPFGMDGAVLKSSSPLNGIFMQSKSAVLTGRSCRILQFAHGSCRFWRDFLYMFKSGDELITTNSHVLDINYQDMMRVLVRRFFMRINHLTSIFRQATGTTVARYILYKRMTIARKELAMGTPAAEAASRAGFGDYSSFFRAYRKMFGCAPTDKTAMELPDMDKSGDF